ncbi:hypothetical protein LPB142_04105 [Rhodobacter xanthinilyticus]|uniref:Uncharacterized protein n=1 Tax=Rhodobacter xanthinilyticus TaxID=1850250 RepID=A0A1D9M9R6_9RHOB|nr:hypothetical protein [Rhodobacter xanthinilyticus]AOZ68602.1 hypothetical protein LPB142_04105 [Rhodobacter xanthinilyticus]
MTHERMTISLYDVASALNVSEAAARGWLLRSGAIPHFARSRYPALMRPDEIIVRLRGARKRGCTSNEAFAILQIDAQRRDAEPGIPFGADCERRAAELRACLTELELSRYLAVRGALHAGLIGALWAEAFKADVGVLLDLALIHPSVMLYVFGGDHSELPQSADAWRHWGHAFAVPQLATLRHLQKEAA